MLKRTFYTLLLTLFSVNAQELQKKVKFAAINSENHLKRANVISILNTLSIRGKSDDLSIYQLVDMKTDSSVVVKELPKVQLVGYYQITKKIVLTHPEWNQSNVDAFGFKLFLCLK